MPFAITLRLDPVSAGTVEDLQLALAEAGIDTDQRDLGYGPHITLAIYPDDTSVDRLRAGLSQLGVWRALPVRFGGIGLFPGPPCIFWIAPVVTAALLEMHAAILAAFPDQAVHPHYRQGAWVPHVSLSGGVQDAPGALATLLPKWCDVDGTLDRVELVRFRPVQVLESRALPG
jgi:2'-5' RNA ligase